ncbi:hypothetical protein A3B45_05265 [Candidatus Daviesbacteria bacterium RIFCSPLOWO2_01_FULL_39_12]|uniref:Uncharacterized protein n=1 Tax=Candidatus Daviesbacteria bacterium RIFCSPLOWO2_01_FULL_39_12 TaxID=1797785 RepID=A0A1F5KQ96_9BACT|nr:MAG: hypothetical protein A3D79_02570 [Candidatus Daviesbacteria bacterium RIFCSPHIGHO2_02_FULL_39_8]OGE43014.1 MAG: hypothetical protein A3B45_05265 [Candidatus Daviesbacteria bacterium RIFCSPLOWO2_01_FULL_39_12]
MDLRWKIYFWLYVIIFAIDLFAILPSAGTLAIPQWIGIVEGVLILLGTYSYAFKKHIFNSKIWKVVLGYMVVVWILGSVYSFVNVRLEAAIFSILIALPGFYAIYHLSEKKK